MNLSHIIGSVITDKGPRPFVLYLQTKKFEVGPYEPADPGQASLSVIHQQQIAQIIHELANVSFAHVRLGQYYCSHCSQWKNALQGQWADGVCPECAPPSSQPVPAQTPAASDQVPQVVAAPKEVPPPAISVEVDEGEMAVIEASLDFEAYPAPTTPSTVDDEEDDLIETQLVFDVAETSGDTLPTGEEVSRVQPSPDKQLLNQLLEKAINLAVTSHSEQVDKAGDPYILHALRVMLRMNTPTEMIVAVLHDVVEDTPWTLEDLTAEGFPEVVTRTVDLLTKQPDEDYDAFIQRLPHDPLARRVKLADLEDNMDIRRIDTLTSKGQGRLNRYLKAWRALKEKED